MLHLPIEGADEVLKLIFECGRVLFIAIDAHVFNKFQAIVVMS